MYIFLNGFKLIKYAISKTRLESYEVKMSDLPMMRQGDRKGGLQKEARDTAHSQRLSRGLRDPSPPGRSRGKAGSGAPDRGLSVITHFLDATVILKIRTYTTEKTKHGLY